MRLTKTTATLGVLVLLAAGALPAVTFADPSARPDAPRGERDDRRGERRGEFGGRRDGGLRERFAERRELMRRAQDPRVVAEALAFFEEHAPRRHELFSEFVREAPAGDRPRDVSRMRVRLVRRYLQIEQLRAGPDGAEPGGLYDLAVRRVEREDDVLGHVLELRDQRQGGADEGAIGATRDALRASVRELVRVTLDEKQARIERLRAELDEEQRRLDAERAEEDELVERKVQQALSDAPPSGPRDRGEVESGDDDTGDERDE